MVQISDSDIGKKVTIRLRDGSGFRDLVGHLVSTDSIRDRRDEVITFDSSEIHLWREIVDVERTASSGAPLSIRIFELEKLTSSTWQAAEEVFVGGWLMRADVGVTKRANSALVLNTEDHIDELITWYGERNLNPIVSLIPDLHHELDKKLEARGFTHLLDMNELDQHRVDVVVECPVGPVIDVFGELKASSAVSKFGCDAVCTRLVLGAVASGDDEQLVAQLQVARTAVVDDAAQRVLHGHRRVRQFLKNERCSSYSLA